MHTWCRRRGVAAAAGLMVLALGSVLAGGCGTSRPVVRLSAAEAAPRELDFYSVLATVPVASRDDVLHAGLLRAEGASPSEPGARRAAAQRLGLIDESWGGSEAAARSAATVRDAAEVLVRAAGEDVDGADAISAMQRWGALPLGVSEHAGITGAQLLALARAADDHEGRAGTGAAAGVAGSRGAARPAVAARPPAVERAGARREGSESFEDFAPAASEAATSGTAASGTAVHGGAADGESFEAFASPVERGAASVAATGGPPAGGDAPAPAGASRRGTDAAPARAQARPEPLPALPRATGAPAERARVTPGTPIRSGTPKGTPAPKTGAPAGAPSGSGGSGGSSGPVGPGGDGAR